MKAKLMALLLAAGLGITGIAMTAQAAETNTVTKCRRHEILHLYEELTGATYHDGQRHLSTYETGYRCAKCPYSFKTKEAIIYESHDYEQIYLPDGSVQSTCTVCGDSYTF